MLSELVPGAPSQLIGMLCPCACGFCPDRICHTQIGETEAEMAERDREFKRQSQGSGLDRVTYQLRSTIVT